MPFLDGFQVLARLQETRRESFLPVMVTTGSAERDLCLRELEAGAQDFVKKPFDGAELAGRLRNLVRLRLMYEAQRASRSHVEAQVEERTAKLPDSIALMNQTEKRLAWLVENPETHRPAKSA